MNNKKIYNLKLIKQKLNAAMVLIEEIQNLIKELPEVESENWLVGALDDLENFYWEIEELQDVEV